MVLGVAAAGVGFLALGLDCLERASEGHFGEKASRFANKIIHPKKSRQEETSSEGGTLESSHSEQKVIRELVYRHKGRSRGHAIHRDVLGRYIRQPSEHGSVSEEYVIMTPSEYVEAGREYIHRDRYGHKSRKYRPRALERQLSRQDRIEDSPRLARERRESHTSLHNQERRPKRDQGLALNDTYAQTQDLSLNARHFADEYEKNQWVDQKLDVNPVLEETAASGGDVAELIKKQEPTAKYWYPTVCFEHGREDYILRKDTDNELVALRAHKIPIMGTERNTGGSRSKKKKSKL